MHFFGYGCGHGRHGSHSKGHDNHPDTPDKQSAKDSQSLHH
jgi:hypothetical protein